MHLLVQPKILLAIACLGLLACLNWAAFLPTDTSRDLAAAACAVLYGALIVLNGKTQWADHRRAFLDKGCPFAVRTTISREDKGLATAKGACLFGGMPVLFMTVPCLVQLLALRSVGSVLASTVMLGALIVGWGYRMLERFALDGCAPMNAVHHMQRNWIGKQQPPLEYGNSGAAVPPPGAGAAGGVRGRAVSCVLTCAAALVSPTAVLHTFTGVTLVVGYLHARSLDPAAAVV